MFLVILACMALPGSQFRDHCEEHRFKMVVDVMPTACVVKAQETIANHPEIFTDVDIASVGCVRPKKDDKNAGMAQATP